MGPPARNGGRQGGRAENASGPSRLLVVQEHAKARRGCGAGNWPPRRIRSPESWILLDGGTLTPVRPQVGGGIRLHALGSCAIFPRDSLDDLRGLGYSRVLPPVQRTSSGWPPRRRHPVQCFGMPLRCGALRCGVRCADGPTSLGSAGNRVSLRAWGPGCRPGCAPAQLRPARHARFNLAVPLGGGGRLLFQSGFARRWTPPTASATDPGRQIGWRPPARDGFRATWPRQVVKHITLYVHHFS